MMTTDDEAVAIRLRRRRLESDVSAMVKRFDPSTYAIRVGALLTGVEIGVERWDHWPAHWMLHSIEACCASAIMHYRRDPSRVDLIDVRNYYQVSDIGASTLALKKEDLELFGWYLFREQLELRLSILSMLLGASTACSYPAPAYRLPTLAFCGNTT